MSLILEALAEQLKQHTAYQHWMLFHNTLSTPHWYNSPLIITLKGNTLEITTHEPNDNNPSQDYPDVKVTTVIDLLDPDFLQKILDDYRLKK